ncbi:S41 family peptidase [Amycolatopsis australiensis]|uniref:Peptidase family S41 n=1 Tax=Amycolatopsis australiensis TaxID=546364 RepID=A0A1K1QLU9_9PSEU|nr:S41 family peptidase [Amycolatopsis australiensis]SFW60684.1 Peptidase family S41 [Amycolatopsis australiensis]
MGGRISLLVTSVVLLFAAGAAPVRPHTPAEFLNRTIALIRAQSIDSAGVDWPRVQAHAAYLARGARADIGTLKALEYVIGELHDPHTMLVFPGQARTSEAEVPTVRTEGGIATLRLPGLDPREAGEGRYLDAGFAALAAVPPVCGWIVDLRGNTGGTMFPMLTVLVPLLGDGPAGAFVGRGGERTPWEIHDGQFWLDGRSMSPRPNPVRLPRRPIAVLTSGDTASSGEASLVALRGIARSFGAPTAGAATGNDVVDLGGGVMLLLTVARDVDRTGRVHGNTPIPPDQPAADAEGAAKEWLRTRGCP